ncbi:MAG: hypothetical protein C4576_17555 [Desulfobacteraceae bacterium]|nr:MAG: hypothetical protein C4576_17555 [Desulfobacteraceae bacterium]
MITQNIVQLLGDAPASREVDAAASKPLRSHAGAWERWLISKLPFYIRYSKFDILRVANYQVL